MKPTIYVLAPGVERLVNKTSEELRAYLKGGGTLDDALFCISALFSDKQLAEVVHRHSPNLQHA